MISILDKLNKENKRCTGCGACFNVCPVRAITMKEDTEGFLYPSVSEKCIDCHKCERTCPVLNPAYENDTDPDCFAMMAPDDERVNSSSGGFVGYTAKKVIELGGIVYGAVWNVNDNSYWNVIFASAENSNELDAIRSSKYLQAETGSIYKDAVKQLKAGRYVLFSGTPCQVAGLKAVVKAENAPAEKLLTIDIVCHGVPNVKLFNKYLQDNYDVKEIKKIDFRDKSYYGWSTCSNVYLKDGTVLRETEKKDYWYRAFLPCMILRPSCETCPFSRLPRQGDFTAGDFWGLARYKKALSDKKLGTSEILVNSEKAKRLVPTLIQDMKLWEEVPIEYATHINKTIIHPFHSHPGRKHFFSIIDKKPFNEAVVNGLEHHYDIGVVGLWYGINYGSVLTYYALYELLRSLGKDPVMLPKPNVLWEDKFNDPESLGQKFIWKYCNVFQPYNTDEDYVLANDNCDDFILGSDVVWKYNVCGKDAGQFFFLDWVESGHRKISYAASFGNGLDGPEIYQNLAKYYLNKFDSISVREENGRNFIRDKVGRQDAEQVMDPVFLCDRSIYSNLADAAEHKRRRPFVFGYMLNGYMLDEKAQVIDLVCDELHATPLITGNPNNYAVSKKRWGKRLGPTLSIEEWLYCVKNCEFYVGDSYHGLCFSLIFHRPFIVISQENANYSSIQRFKSLLRLVNLEYRLVKESGQTSEDFRRIIETPIDWEKTDEILKEKCEYSLSWLKNALDKPIREVQPDDYLHEKSNRNLLKLSNDLRGEINNLSRRIDEQNRLINEQSILVEELKKYSQVNRKVYENGKYLVANGFDHTARMLFGHRAVLYEIGDVTELRTYLNTIKDSNCTALFSVKDIQGYYLKQQHIRQLEDMGFYMAQRLGDKNYHSFIGVCSNGKAIYQQVGNDDRLLYKSNVNGFRIRIVSSTLNAGNAASIGINGTEFAVNARGINIVVIDNNTGNVIDSVAFDTHSEDIICIRNQLGKQA